jgi:two-component system, NtrC family, nitrogen regulation response regulator NtrX
MPSILIVDDEANIRRLLTRLLEAEGYAVRQAPDGAAGLAAADADEPDAVLLDLSMPGIDGLEVLAELRRRRPDLPVVMISGRATLGDAVQATKLGAFHFIEKPLTPEAVLLTVKGAVELRRARALTRALAQEFGPGDQLVGGSAAMERLRALIRQVAPTDARVLLTGESGTGKELVAAALHATSRRAAGAFIRVNSAAIPRDLVESELFGHERGAFTGATEMRRGRFELADGGTLFLDEVADLGAEAQAKLLRALEAGQIERVGGQRPIPVDVRVVAATNRDLRAEIAAGRFRDDLFYRLNVVPIHLPPLRERAEDVPALVAHFMARLQLRHGIRPPDLCPEAIAALGRHHWPGNVRELANICERLAILRPAGRVEGRDVAVLLAADPPLPAAAAAPAGAATEPGATPLALRLDDYERALIRDAIAAADGNVADAARRLDTDRANLYRRMKRLGIDR